MLPVILALPPPRWLDPATGETGPLDTGLAPATVAALLRVPPVPASAVAPLVTQLAKTGLGGTHLPRAVDAAAPLDVAPRAVAVVMLSRIDEAAVLTPARSRWQETLTTELAVVRLLFDYAGKRLGAASGASPFTRVIDDRLVSVARQPAAEAKFVKRLRAAGLTGVAQLSGLRPAPDQQLDFAPGSHAASHDLVPFLLDTRPALEAEDWQVEVAPDFPLVLAVPSDADWQLEIAAAASPPSGAVATASGIDWFDATLGIEVDGERIDVLPAVVQMLRLLPPGFDPGDTAAAGAAIYATTGARWRCLTPNCAPSCRRFGGCSRPTRPPAASRSGCRAGRLASLPGLPRRRQASRSSRPSGSRGSRQPLPARGLPGLPPCRPTFAQRCALISRRGSTACSSSATRASGSCSPTIWGSARPSRRSRILRSSTLRGGSTHPRWWSRQRACFPTGQPKQRRSRPRSTSASGTAPAAPRARTRLRPAMLLSLPIRCWRATPRCLRHSRGLSSSPTRRR